MDPISNNDRLLALLRQKLQERAKTSGAARRTQAEAKPAPRSAVHALAAVSGTEDRMLRRAFIQNLLADQLDPSLVNAGGFQQVVGRVLDAIEDDEAAAALLTRLIAELKAE
jgi:hypothetical protein